MRKLYTHVLLVLVGTFFLASCIGSHNPLEFEDDENEGYDGPAQRDSLEYMKIVDPALGYVPYNRLYEAINYTENLKSGMSNSRLQQAIVWEERGPIFDSLGPSNGNSRAGVNYTSGRIRAVMVDTLNDPTGNTVFVGGVAGGLWRCTNFLAAIPNWQVVNDYFDNLAI
ncbi:MAG: hypothetical protein JWP88_1694, partial [Flaviaesturariibacter sp.]|nr:hypothetical protein [Flaviaesturariibacter sp.]